MFRVKDEYRLEVKIPETMKLLGIGEKNQQTK